MNTAAPRASFTTMEYVVCALLHDIGDTLARSTTPTFATSSVTTRGSSALHPFVNATDGPAFDPQGETLPLEFFEPMVRRIFAALRQTLYTAFADPSVG